MQKTTNLELNILDGTDTFNPMTAYNPNFETIDETLGNVDLSITSLNNATSSLGDSVTALTATVAGKVDAVEGKGLSTEDYTTAEQTKLAGIATGATNVTIDNTVVSGSNNAARSGDMYTKLAGKSNSLITQEFKLVFDKDHSPEVSNSSGSSTTFTYLALCFSKNIAKSGYTPIGIVGVRRDWDIHLSIPFPIVSYKISENTAEILLDGNDYTDTTSHNDSINSYLNLYVTVLYVKNS